MIYLIYGAVGALMVLGVLAAGVFIGWKAGDAARKYGGSSTAGQETEEQRRQLKAQQQAFESMLSYNTDTAYGIDPAFSALMGGAECE